MKTRILTAAVGIPLLFVLDIWAPLWVFGVVFGLVNAGAAFELMHCVCGDLGRRNVVWPTASAFLIPLAFSLDLGMEWAAGIAFVLFFFLFLQLMLSFRHAETMKMETVTVGLMGGAVMPMMLSAVVRLALPGGTLGRACMLLPFILAFSTDAGAYFAGVTLGKRKLCPRLSPHKTVAGALGGLVAGTGMTVVYGLVLRLFGLETRLPLLAVYGLLGAVTCQLGDLSFSAVKRVCGIKDFGKILPGHGGMLDRFDSMYYMAPLLELLFLLAPAILR